MRASEFINESYKPGKISKRQRFATKGLHKFRDPQGFDRTYEMNRLGMALACTDGDIVPEVDQESWAGRFNTAHPYTEAEQRMLEKAYKAMGSQYTDLNKGDLNSDEVPGTNNVSPVKAFKGYKK
jgi:hypothetical protein